MINRNWTIMKNGKYKINRYGTIINLKDGLQASQWEDPNGYVICYLKGVGTFKLYRLVAKYYVTNPTPHMYHSINHKNEDKFDNWANNLEWCNAKYNNNYGHHEQRVIQSYKENSSKPVLLFKFNKNCYFPKISDAAFHIYNECPGASYSSIEAHLGNIADHKVPYHFCHGYYCTWASDYIKGIVRQHQGICIKRGSVDKQFSDLREAAIYVNKHIYGNVSLHLIEKGLLSVCDGKRYSYHRIVAWFGNKSYQDHVKKFRAFHPSKVATSSTYTLLVCGHKQLKGFNTLKEAAIWVKEYSHLSNSVNDIKRYLDKVATSQRNQHIKNNNHAYGFACIWYPKAPNADDRVLLKNWIAKNYQSNSDNSKSTVSIQLTKGKFNKCFTSMREAAEYLKRYKKLSAKTVTISNAISMVCRGKRKHAYGFRCKYIRN